ncbi:MAG TPA: caspase family protein [Polyangia bacterium]|nr:caspase family protein [Polyangia bacterium]
MKRALLTLALLLVRLSAAQAGVNERYFALVVGYNGPPSTRGADAPLPLRYADDDALSFYELEHEAGTDAVLLTVPDADSRRRFPWAADVARPPTLSEIERAVTDLNKRMAATFQAGHKPVFVFFYSGHGSRDQSTGAALTLPDGALSGAGLREHILDKIHAQTVHLIIDACHADAIARPRDIDAKTMPITQAEIMARLSAEMSSSYPNVGLVLASDGGSPTHEWDLYQSGIFTHEVISGLRGGADVNHDGRIEYSELAAFLTAANTEVLDTRARVQSILQAPSIQARAPLIELGEATSAGWLTNIQSTARQFFVEDQHGTRILDGHPEYGFAMSVAVPPDQLLFVHDGEREADVVVPRGERRAFDALTFHKSPLQARGAMETSLEKGLFLMPYGPGYYNGFVDRRDAVRVPGVQSIEISRGIPPSGVSTRRKTLVWTLRGASGALLGSAVLFAGLTLEARSNFEAASTQVAAAQANDRFKLDSTLALTFLASAVVCAAVSFVVDLRK